MLCPSGHGNMILYEDSAFKRKYMCASCNFKMDLDTKTGKAVQITTGLAVVGAIGLAVSKFFFRGGGDSGGGDSA